MDTRHKKYENKGLSGLANLGNTCFINSCVQVLSHTYELNDFLDSDKYSNNLKKQRESVLLVEWNNLRQLLWSENCIISPAKFIRTIQQLAKVKGTDIFTGFAQNDLPEFLLFLVDCFHTSMSREVKMNINGNIENDMDTMAVKCYTMIKNMYANEYSEVWNLFYGVHVSQIQEMDDDIVLSSSPEPYFMIDLPLPSQKECKNPSLLDCFDYYTTGEKMIGENAWYNNDTKKKQDVRKTIMFWSLPTILTIDLKRFNHKNQKNQRLVTFPLDNFDLSKYVIGYNKESYVYDLYGICNHSGGVHGGHYTAYVKNANGKWYLYNDTTVKEVKNPSEIISTQAYCFFYRKK